MASIRQIEDGAMKRRGISAARRAAFAPWHAYAPALFGAALSLSACSTPPGSFDVEDTNQTKWTNLMSMVQFKSAPRQPEPMDPVTCPDIVILDGTAEDRVYASGDETNANLRYQFSINDIARDCRVNGSQLSLRVGVAGKILLGPAGSPGSFSGPVRVAVIDENKQEPVYSKLYQVGVEIPAGQSEGTFSLVTETFDVPYMHAKAQHDYTIKVGFDIAGGKHKPLPEASQRIRSTPASTSGDSSTPHHHRHRGAPASTD
jgi:hypothetical protein